MLGTLFFACKYIDYFLSQPTAKSSLINHFPSKSLSAIPNKYMTDSNTFNQNKKLQMNLQIAIHLKYARKHRFAMLVLMDLYFSVHNFSYSNA